MVFMQQTGPFLIPAMPSVGKVASVALPQVLPFPQARKRAFGSAVAVFVAATVTIHRFLYLPVMAVRFNAGRNTLQFILSAAMSAR
jgi:hypothetical protein